ncbi:inositol monophosphatase 1 isoform X2 [Cololabis saira]|uniref:inositol monophosphatase 1 isoform X2 n=1 Tax=Cololabis saira TaxID=129043 RepID=UPI002AD1E1F7|nr:inositol monophosphatase 1 isoform X2 [Cololabis saira]
MADFLQNVMDHAVAVARKAGEVVCSALSDERKIMTKSSAVDLVTQTDQRVEQLIIQSVKEKFPSHRFIGEESVAAGESCILTDEPTWIIDPIDGTTNFVHTWRWVWSTAVWRIKCSRPGGGRERSVTARLCRFLSRQLLSDIHQAIIATEFGSNRDLKAVDHIFFSLRNILTLPVHGVRGAGTAAVNMCLVALGCVEAYYEIGIHVWDIAAGLLIVSEAGGVLMDVTGGDVDLMSRRIVAANNKTIAEKVIEQIDPFTPPRDDAPPLDK